MNQTSVIMALVVGLGSVVESLPAKAQRRACDLMADIVATGLVDSDAEALIKTFARPAKPK
jgi:hypothetical protein